VLSDSIGISVLQFISISKVGIGYGIPNLEIKLPNLLWLPNLETKHLVDLIRFLKDQKLVPQEHSQFRLNL